jgi:hypothetical protein
VPYYIKCDIENGDAIFVRQLLRDARRPAFVSIEATSVGDLACLEACGYDRFQLVNQMFHQFFSIPPEPAREGVYVQAHFDGHCSGLFGRELDPSRWTDFGEVAERFLEWDRLRTKDPQLACGWLDVHAGYSTNLVAG